MRFLLVATALISVSHAAQAQAPQMQQRYGQTQPYTQYRQAAPAQNAYEQNTQTYSNAPTTHNGQQYPYYYTPPPKAPPHKPWYGAFHAQYVIPDKYEFSSVGDRFVTRGEIEFDNGFGLGGALGYRLAKYFRIEGEATYRKFELDQGVNRAFDTDGNLLGESRVDENTDDEENREYGMNTINLMVNAIVDLPLPFAEDFAPYGGAGFGWSYQTNGAKESSFAYQFLGGLSWQADEETAFNLGYRYFEATGFDFDGFNQDYEATQHIVELGMRYHF